MAKKRPEDPPAGSPAWMATFSDLMNLLLCFFVLLFSMSTVDADKLEQVVASMQSTISILPAGGSSIGDGELISAGVRQLEFMDSYYNEMANSAAEDSKVQSGKAELVKEAQPIVDKIGKILEKYDKHVIEVEGHTDNVPINSKRYENNEVLSLYRALSVTKRLRDKTDLDPKYIKFAGRGDYVPIADNSTPEGRARNRRVEIKVYNSYNSDVD